MPEVKAAKVKDVIGIKPFTNSYGTTFYHKILMDNGDLGEIGKKQEGGIKIGDSLTYTIEPGPYGDKIKEYREPGNNYGGGGDTATNHANDSFQPGVGGGNRNASFALSYAKDCIIAEINAGKVSFEGTAALADAVINVANRFNAWFQENA